jgi:hypothetical protein
MTGKDYEARQILQEISTSCLAATENTAPSHFLAINNSLIFVNYGNLSTNICFTICVCGNRAAHLCYGVSPGLLPGIEARRKTCFQTVIGCYSDGYR